MKQNKWECSFLQAIHQALQFYKDMSILGHSQIKTSKQGSQKLGGTESWGEEMFVA